MVQNPWYFIDSLLATSSQYSSGCSAIVALPLPWLSLAHFLGTTLVLPGFHSLASSACFIGGSAQSIMVVLGHTFLACPHISFEHLLSVFLSNPWRFYLLEEIIGLHKELAKIGRIYFPPLRLYSLFHIGCLGQRFFCNHVLLIFIWQLSLVLPLLWVGRG